MSFYCPGCKRKYRYTHAGDQVCMTKGCTGSEPSGTLTPSGVALGAPGSARRVSAPVTFTQERAEDATSV